MNTPRPRPIVFAVLAVLALGVTAATLNSPVQSETGLVGTGGGAAGQSGDDLLANQPNRGAPRFSPFRGEGIVSFESIGCPASPGRGGIAIGLGVLVAISYLIYRDTDIAGAVAFLVVVGPPLGLLYWGLKECGTGDSEALTETGSFLNASFGIGPIDAAGGASGGGRAIEPTVTVLLLGVVAVGLLFSLGLFLRSGSDAGGQNGPDEETAETEPSVDIARVAGRAASRIDRDADPENEVYRAWQEMTDLLDVPDPDSSTPGEFATAAVDAGMDQNDVSELTRLFEDVRYGIAEPTREREKRAVAVLRRIENTYGEGVGGKS